MAPSDSLPQEQSRTKGAAGLPQSWRTWPPKARAPGCRWVGRGPQAGSRALAGHWDAPRFPLYRADKR